VPASARVEVWRVACAAAHPQAAAAWSGLVWLRVLPAQDVGPAVPRWLLQIGPAVAVLRPRDADAVARPGLDCAALPASAPMVALCSDAGLATMHRLFTQALSRAQADAPSASTRQRLQDEADELRSALEACGGDRNCLARRLDDALFRRAQDR
jgi:hypothetical protein